jgi:hypothetical protein
MRTEVEDCIKAMMERNDGQLEAQTLVEAARDKAHPAHAEIWSISDKDAAMEHRVGIARRLISQVRMIISDPVTLFPDSRVPFAVKNPNGSGYITVAKCRTNEDMARDAVIEAFAKANSEMRRARQLARVLGMDESAIEATISQIVTLESRARKPTKKKARLDEWRPPV